MRVSLLRTCPGGRRSQSTKSTEWLNVLDWNACKGIDLLVAISLWDNDALIHVKTFLRCPVDIMACTKVNEILRSAGSMPNLLEVFTSYVKFLRGTIEFEMAIIHNTNGAHSHIQLRYMQVRGVFR